MHLQNHINSFLKDLKKFNYTLSGIDPVWEVLFKTPNEKWNYLHISKYQKTFYISHINGDIGSLEVIPGKHIKIAVSGVFSEPQAILPNEKRAKKWLKIIIAATKWLTFCAKNWIKANAQVQKEYPLDYRYGTVAGSLIRELLPDQFRLDKALGKSKAKQFIRLVENNYFLNEQNFIGQSMTADRYFEYCKIAYMAAAVKKDSLSDTESGRAMYQRFADGRHEGLLDIDPDSEQEFADWLDGKHPKRSSGGHPWEIKRGGSFTHIGLRVQRPYYAPKEGFKVELYGNANIRLAETIKMFLALHNAGFPIAIADPDGIRKRLLGQDNFGIIPSHESLSRANQHFLPEEDVHDVMYFNDLGRYKKRLTPFIRWEALPLLRSSYLS